MWNSPPGGASVGPNPETRGAKGMLIHLFRHGIAIDRDDPEAPPEADRFLTGKGRRRTRRAAEGLRRIGAAPDLVISSPWTRARQTAELALEALDLDESQLVLDEDLLPMAPPGRILDKLADLDHDEILLVGHAPQLDLLLDELTGGASLERLTKAGAACVRVDPRRPQRGVLCWLLPSRGLRRMARD